MMIGESDAGPIVHTSFVLFKASAMVVYVRKADLLEMLFRLMCRRTASFIGLGHA